MKKLTTISAAVILLTTTAFAAGTHSEGHGHSEEGEAHGHDQMMAMGMPGITDEVDRTIDVVMRETDDGEMLFEPRAFDIKRGETIRFNVMNKGDLEHEFVLGTPEENVTHKEMMAKMDMEHDDPFSIRLDEGQSGEVIWNFANAGSFEFACLIPGHYESGMHGPINVGDQIAEATVEYSAGTVKKVNSKAGKVTIIHGPLTNLDMPSMTMVFRADEEIIARMSEGQEIEFVADRVQGKLTVTTLR